MGIQLAQFIRKSLRDHLAASPSDVVYLLMETTSVNWPHDDAKIFSCEEQTGETFFDPSFVEHVRDLSNWTIDSSLLSAYPSFRGLAKFRDVTSDNRDFATS
jgi:hypothetical protein